MKRILGMLMLLLLLSATGSYVQGRDRYRDDRSFRKNIQVVVATPYSGGYFVQGHPPYGRYFDPGYGRYRDKHLRKRYYKKLKQSRRGYVYYHDHDGRCHHRH
jgi:hypothetical protein